MAVLSMSKQEFTRLDVLLRFRSGRLRVADAGTLIGLGRRQLFRLLRGVKQDGATSLLSKRRGKPSNHRLPAEVRSLAVSLVRERYIDFGPTFAAEKLSEVHGCTVSRETLRGRMIADGLWVDRRHRLASPHQPQRRRDCVGELVQIDGSEHAWFEARGDACTLLAFIDDATSRFAVQFDGMSLSFRVFDKIRTVEPGTIVENKRLGAALALVKEHQAIYAPNQRRYDPARGRPPNNLEAPGMPTKNRTRRDGLPRSSPEIGRTAAP